ncbi:hypothetical protein [Pedobacter sp.]|uniref:hypothetical protein n=1 Tax=Pedobacter sp. TaxID=1411316 RepID=UPI003C3819DB
MEILKMETDSPVSTLHQLLDRMHQVESSLNLHLGHSKINSIESTNSALLGLRVLGVNEHFFPGMLRAMGIRSVTFDSQTDPRPMLALNKMMEDANGKIDVKKLIGSKEALELMKMFLRSCRTVAFDDWVSNEESAEIWELFLFQIIADLDQSRLEFVFYMGDPRTKDALEVEQMLKIMDAFSAYGKVTLALDRDEANHLWEIVNEVDISISSMHEQLDGNKKRYLSLFNTLGVNNLLVYSPDHAMLFSTGLQLEISRRKAPLRDEISLNARDHFIAGFTSGLLMNLEMASCLTLGLIVFGSNGAYNSMEDEHIRLSNYVREWISELQ